MALISKTSKINAEKITARQVVENTNSPKNLESEKIVEKKKEPSNKNEITKESVAKRKLSDQILKKRKSIANPVRDEVSVKIEKILEEGLEDAYQRLSPIAKQEFKLKGEQTALKIRDLLRDTHIKVKNTATYFKLVKNSSGNQSFLFRTRS